MKLLLLAFSITFSCAVVQAQDKIICTLSESANPLNVAIGEADLNNLSEEGLYSIDGIDVGDDNYSFDMSITKEANGAILVDVIFYENIHVQDEVASYSWKLQQKGLSVIQEPLQDNSNATIMNFVCDYK